MGKFDDHFRFVGFPVIFRHRNLNLRVRIFKLETKFCRRSVRTGTWGGRVWASLVRASLVTYMVVGGRWGSPYFGFCTTFDGQPWPPSSPNMAAKMAQHVLMQIHLHAEFHYLAACQLLRSKSIGTNTKSRGEGGSDPKLVRYEQKPLPKGGGGGVQRPGTNSYRLVAKLGL